MSLSVPTVRALATTRWYTSSLTQAAIERLLDANVLVQVLDHRAPCSIELLHHVLDAQFLAEQLESPDVNGQELGRD